MIAEEGGEYAADDAWAWLVDPLDGTNNVAIGLPAYVVGIALCERGSPVLGVVHDPVTGHTWSAVRGQGAFVHASGPAGRPLRAAAPTGAVRAGAGLDPGSRGTPGRQHRPGVEGGAGLHRPAGAATVGAAAVVGDAGPRRHRRDRRLPAGGGRPAGRAAAGRRGRHDRPGARRRLLRRPVRRARPSGAASSPARRRRIDRLVKLVTAAQWIEPQVRHLTPISLTTVGW